MVFLLEEYLFTNHLAEEKSPYLLQHAHNPVDWYPWCEEAFVRAKKEQKPIFLSIGYSTCHWCHVMEQESFEDRKVAELLNEDYISIKVDREERPDVDSVYMNVCQMLTGSGGWPLTILMTAEQKPFYAGTYLPKEDSYGRMGLCTLLRQVSGKWKRERTQIYRMAEDIVEYLNRREDEVPQSVEKQKQVKAGIQTDAKDLLQTENEELMQEGAFLLSRMFDGRNGGFSGAPKFPVPHNLLFLMKLYESDGNAKWLEMTEVTLQQMFRGGIFDHIGGGFSRYSTDKIWLVPHFEKMLYDNALLSMAYLEAYRLTEDVFFMQVAQRTLAYITQELTHEKGGFFCGQDADSEGEEGKYYVFTKDEILRVLGETQGEKFCEWYGITRNGNFENKSILNLLGNGDYRKEPEEISTARDLLYEYRKQRTVLHRDDKVLTSWNGLALWAFARAFQITGKTAYYKQAKAAALFVRANLMTSGGHLKVRWREEHVAYEGNLDDYAFYAVALLELYQCDFDVSWLRTCIRLTEEMLELFEDKELGGCFFYGDRSEALISRPKETYDGAIPSGNSMAGLLLVRLAKLTGEQKWIKAAARQLAFLKENSKGYEAGHTMALLAVTEWEQKGIHLMCRTETEIPEEEIRCYRRRQKENVSAVVITEENRQSLERLIPQVADYPLQPGKIMYYVCRGEACQPPVSELSDAL